MYKLWSAGARHETRRLLNPAFLNLDLLPPSVPLLSRSPGPVSPTHALNPTQRRHAQLNFPFPFPSLSSLPLSLSLSLSLSNCTFLPTFTGRVWRREGGNPFLFRAVLARTHPPPALRLFLRLAAPTGRDLFPLAFPSFFAAHARALIDATPTSILICREDGNDLFPDADDGAAGADLVVARDDRLLVVDQDDEYVAVLLSKETAGCGGAALAEEMEDWMKAARSGCVRWIIKTTAMFRFSGKTAYVAVTYLDRFLAQRRVNRGQEWALQLLAVACLSLASKVEENHAPRLSELRPDVYEFDSESILRMELLVLGTLGWRMIAATPFPYISCFAARFRHDERRPIVLRAVECVFAAIKEMSSVEYQPSTIAVASILVARGGEANLDELKAILGSSWPQLDTGHVYSCYSAMVQEEDKSSMHSAELASSSGASVAAHAGSSPDASVGTNNAAAPPRRQPRTTTIRGDGCAHRSPQRQ